MFDKLRKKLKDSKKDKGESYGDGGVPTNKELYSRVKSEAKKKFRGDYPSAYASAWLVREYKKRGGGYRKK